MGRIPYATSQPSNYPTVLQHLKVFFTFANALTHPVATRRMKIQTLVISALLGFAVANPVATSNENAFEVEIDDVESRGDFGEGGSNLNSGSGWNGVGDWKRDGAGHGGGDGGDGGNGGSGAGGGNGGNGGNGGDGGNGGGGRDDGHPNHPHQSSKPVHPPPHHNPKPLTPPHPHPPYHPPQNKCPRRWQAVPFFRNPKSQCAQWTSNTWDSFYTTNAWERDQAVQQWGYKSRGTAGYIFPNNWCGGVPLFRLYSQRSKQHFYTTSWTERSKAISIGYRDEGVTGYVFKY
ncbi:hypothetical protein FPV67DRAFT_1654789 [Lyophyllum atratum]|nr:hypothetical protein FPV67DRAFT_1654789 [Lyophyllum atratum]